MRRVVILAVAAVLSVPIGWATTVASASHTAGAGQGAFVTGGGRYDTSECAINFSLNGRVTPQGPAGEQTATMSNAPGAIAGCPGQGQIKATVTCVAVNGPDAEIRGLITKQSGSFGPDFFPPGTAVFVTDVQDNGNAGSPPDTIVQYVDDPGTETSCSAPSGDQLFTVDEGNITVHD